MRKLLLLVTTLTVSAYSVAQTLVWPLSAATQGAFTKQAKVTAPADVTGKIATEAFKVGNGLTESFNSTSSTTELYVSPKKADINTSEAAIEQGQTLEVGFINNHETNNYIVKSISFDIAVSSPTLRVEALIDPYLTPDWEIKKYTNLLTEATWSALPKNGTYQRVSLTLPAEMASTALYMVTLQFAIYNAQTTDKISIKNINVTLEPSVATSIHSAITAPSTTETIYNVRGQRVDTNYKGIVIKNGRKFVQ